MYVRTRASRNANLTWSSKKIVKNDMIQDGMDGVLLAANLVKFTHGMTICLEAAAN